VIKATAVWKIFRNKNKKTRGERQEEKDKRRNTR
jgi:hypothetical protein